MRGGARPWLAWALVCSGTAAFGQQQPHCPIAGEPVWWMQDVCMARVETDDEIGTSECLQHLIDQKLQPACEAKRQYKRQLCALAIDRKTYPGALEGCVADPAFRGRTVRNEGVGG